MSKPRCYCIFPKVIIPFSNLTLGVLTKWLTFRQMINQALAAMVSLVGGCSGTVNMSN